MDEAKVSLEVTYIKGVPMPEELKVGTNALIMLSLIILKRMLISVTLSFPFKLFISVNESDNILYLCLSNLCILYFEISTLKCLYTGYLKYLT